jgi:hypothetical protein
MVDGGVVDRGRAIWERAAGAPTVDPPTALVQLAVVSRKPQFEQGVRA